MAVFISLSIGSHYNSMHALQTEEFSVRAEVLSSPAILKHATTNAGSSSHLLPPGYER